MGSPAPDLESQPLGKDTKLPLRPEYLDPRPHRRHPFSSFVPRKKFQTWTSYQGQKARIDNCGKWAEIVEQEFESMHEETEKILRIQAHLSGLPQKTENNDAAPTTPPEQLGAATSTPSHTTSMEDSDKIDIAFVASLHHASLRRLELLVDFIKYESDQISADMRESEPTFSLLMSVITVLWSLYTWWWMWFLLYGVPWSLKPSITIMNLWITIFLNMFADASRK